MSAAPSPPGPSPTYDSGAMDWRSTFHNMSINKNVACILYSVSVIYSCKADFIRDNAVFPVNRDTGTADRMQRAGCKVINPSTAALVGNLAPTHQLQAPPSRHVSHVTSVSGVLTSHISCNQTCKRRLTMFVMEQNIKH